MNSKKMPLLQVTRIWRLRLVFEKPRRISEPWKNRGGLGGGATGSQGFSVIRDPEINIWYNPYSGEQLLSPKLIERLKKTIADEDPNSDVISLPGL
jgi:hypothetical protein